MLKIGDFSKLSKISIRMLRYYDELGILNPEYINKESGYRYYSPEQLSLAFRIQALKDMGFSLDTIQDILKTYDDIDNLKRYLLLRYDEMEIEVMEKQSKLKLLKSIINRIGKDCDYMKYNVVIKELPSRYVASLRGILPGNQQDGLLWDKLSKQIESQKVEYTSPCFPVTIYYDEGYKEKDVDVEIQISVNGKYIDTEDVRFITTEPMTVASVIITGSYEQLPEANEAVAKYISDNEFTMSGPMFNIYHVNPGMEMNSGNWITEICYPVTK
ncbi:MAG: merR [Anaerosolibacter sp.]|uniref:MerR family transcriptional regulator n=1 Tax=Anaerosolibacter sp. TaxID=1872527 RepID=UPI002A386B0B|nr:merR [Anaerosolibacter sp.]